MKWPGLTTLALATLTTVWAETSKKTATYNFGKFSGDYPAHMRPQNGLCNIIVQSKVPVPFDTANVDAVKYFPYCFPATIQAWGGSLDTVSNCNFIQRHDEWGGYWYVAEQLQPTEDGKIIGKKIFDITIVGNYQDVTDKATQGGKLIGPFWDPRAQAIGAATVDGHRASVYPIEMEEGDAAQCPDA